MMQTFDRVISNISVEYAGTNIYSYSFNYNAETGSGLKRLSGYSRTVKGTGYESSINFGYSSHTPGYTKKIINGSPGVGTPDIGECKRMAETCQLAANEYTPPQIKTPAIYLCAYYEIQKVRVRCETGNTLGYGDFNGDGYQDVIGSTDQYSGDGRVITSIKEGALLSYQKDTNESVYTKGTGFHLDMNGDGRDDYVRFSSNHYVVSFASPGGTGDSFFSGETHFNEPAYGRGMGYESEKSLLEKLLELWIDYQLQKLEVKKTRAMNNLTGAMSGIGLVTGGIMGFAAGNIVGSIAGKSLYGDMGKGVSAQLQLGKQVLGMQGDGRLDAFAQFADINGDGLQDYVRLIAAGSGSGKIATAFNTGSSFGTDVLSSGINTGIPVTSSAQATASLDLTGLEDLNEDGVVDELDLEELTDEEQAQYLSNGAATTSSSKGFRALGDVNGDGVPDFVALVNENGFRLAMHMGRRDGSFGSPVMSTVLEPGSEKFRFLADLNGDGYSDFVRSDSTKVLISYGNGQGFGYTHTSEVGESHDTGKSLGDVNGDGTPDFLRLAKDGNGHWHTMARIYRGKGFDGGEVDLGFYHPDSGSASTRLIFYGDVNGDGLSDVIAPSNNGSNTELYVSSRGSSFSLSEVSNGYHKISVSYKSGLENSSPSINQRFGGTGGYSILANTSPRLVVDSLVVQDKNGTNKSKVVFSYTGEKIKIGPTPEETRSLGPSTKTEKGYYWSGSSWVQGPTYSVVTYYQGEDATTGYKTVGMEKKGVVYRTADGSLLSESTPSYTLRSSNPSMKNGKSVYLVLPDLQVTRDKSTNLTIEKKEKVASYNEYGQPLCSIGYGDTAVSGDDTATVITYTTPASSVYASVPETVKVFSGHSCSGSKLISYQKFVYDAAGNVIKKISGPDSAHTRSITTAYDFAGNPTSVTRYGLTTSMTYDTDTASYPVRVTSPEGFISSRSYEPDRGLLLSETDPDGRTINHTYDALGRKTGSSLTTSVLSSVTLSSTSYETASDGGMTVTRKSLVAGEQEQTTTSVTDGWGRQVSKSVSTPRGNVYTTKRFRRTDLREFVTTTMRKGGSFRLPEPRIRQSQT